MIKECHGYIIVVEPVDKHHCHVHVHQSKDKNQDFEDMTPQQLLETVNTAELSWIYGTIKWDDCGNFNWNPQNVQTHFCGRREFINILEAIWDCANEVLSQYDKEK